MKIRVALRRHASWLQFCVSGLLPGRYLPSGDARHHAVLAYRAGIRFFPPDWFKS